MKIFVYLYIFALLFVVFDSGCKTKTEHIKPPTVSVTAHELFAIDEGQDKKSVIGRMGHIKTDKNKKIYISDEMSLYIKVFNPNGTFDKNIGGRGQAPGQFQEITDFVIMGDSVLVFDRTLSVVHILDLDGKFIGSKKISSKSHVFPALVYSFGNKMIFLNKSDNDNNFLTINDFDKKESVLNFSDIDLSDDNFFNGFVRWVPGHVAVHQDKIYYAPALYTDKIYVSEFKDNKWNMSYMKGFTEFEKPYTSLDEKSSKEYLKTLSNYGDFGYKDKKYLATIHTFSNGVYTFKNKILLNFIGTSTIKQKKTNLFVEVFDIKTALSIGYGEIKSLQKLDNTVITKPRLLPQYKDENDVFYVIDNSFPVPVIRAVKLKIES